ncbi:MAG: hypothetical protein V1899_10585 [Planctomycetota bacterium]
MTPPNLLSAGEHTLRWTYAKNYRDADLADAGWIDNVKIYNYPKNWSVSGNSNWGLPSVGYNDSLWSAKSGPIGNDQSSSLSYTITPTQTAEVTFYWSVSSCANTYGADYLIFYIDDIQQNAIAGAVPWTYQSYLLSAGEHTLRWTYAKNYRDADLADAGWIDNVKIYNYPKNWSVSGNSNWGLPNAGYGPSIWSARSGPIGDNQSSSLSYETTSTQAAEVTFYWSVSSCANAYGADYLIFYIDDAQQNAIAGDVGWTYQSYLLTAGTHTLRWTYVKNYRDADLADAGWIDQVRVQTYDSTWELGGNSLWQVETDPLHVYSGTRSGRSGHIGDGQETWIQKTLNLAQAAEVTFWWSVSSCANSYGADYLIFYIDGAQQNAIAGDVGWTYQSYLLTAGTHTLRWTYVKNYRDADLADAGWVDQVRVQTYDSTWKLGGNSLWQVETDPLHVYSGTRSGRSGHIGDNQETWIQKTLNLAQAAEVTFYWSVSSCANAYGADYLIFYIDDAQQNAIAGDVGWTYQSYLLTAGPHTLRWTYAKNYRDADLADAGWVDQVRVQTYDSTWELGGNSLWQADTSRVYSGTRSGRSGHIGDRQETWIQKTLNLAQAAEVTFYWSVSSCANAYGADYLIFYIDGAQQNAIAGDVGWTYQSYLLTAGTHTLRWTYAKNYRDADLADAGWIDQVRVQTYDSTWELGGNSLWQTVMAPDRVYSGTRSARSGHIGDNQQTWIQKTLNLAQDSELTFYWSVSSCANAYGADYLIFYIDGAQQAAITGEVWWAPLTRSLSAGTHTLLWTYAKNYRDAAGADAGWIDQVRVRYLNDPPPIAGGVGVEDPLITISGAAANWRFKLPALEERVRYGSASNWIWTPFRDNGLSLIVPRGSNIDWRW